MNNLDSLIINPSQPWIKENTIYLTKHGSNAYGTATPESDLDLRGICVPPKKYLFGVLDNFEQHQSMEPNDLTIFSLKKFVKLALDNNPNALEIIFTEECDHIYRAPILDKLMASRDLFLSKKCYYSFEGYARSQFKRINLHRNYFLNPPKKKPERADFGLPDNNTLIPPHQVLEIDAAINKKVNDWHLDTTGLEKDTAIDIKNKISDILLELKLSSDEFDLYAARSLGLNDNLMEAFKQERKYKNGKREWDNYQSWKKNRNPKRAALEEKYGVDLKHASHLYRLYVMCREVLETHKLTVKRPDAEQILAIKNGAWTYEQLVEWSNVQSKELEEIYKKSTLRHQPENNKINNICMEMIEKFYAR